MIAGGDIQAIAAEWFARTLSGEATEADQRQLEAWLEADPRHRGAFIRTQAMWEFLGSSTEAAAEPFEHSELSDEQTTCRGWRPTRRTLLGGALALAACVAGIQILPDVLFAEHQSFETSRGETRAVTLSDGSQIILNADTRAETVLKLRERQVQLVAGEGWFHVAKDKARPFIVEADGVTVTAVGTAFSVGKSDGLRVVVSEGVIDIAQSGKAPTRVHRNQTALIDHGVIRVTTIDDEEVRRQLAWRDGSIGFDGETLSEAVASFNRFNADQLVVADNELGNRRVVGWFSRSDPLGFAEASAAMFGGKVEKSGGRIVLSRK